MSNTLEKQVAVAASAAEASQSAKPASGSKAAASSRQSSDYYQLEEANYIRTLEDGTSLQYSYNERVPLLGSAGSRLKSPTKKQLEEHIIDFRVINPGKLHQIVFIDTASKPTDVQLGAAIWEHDITLDDLVWLRSEDGFEFAICLNAFVSLPGGGKNKPRVIRPKLFRLGDKTAHLAQSRTIREELLNLAVSAFVSRTQHACPINNAILNTFLKDPTRIAQLIQLIKTHGNCALGKCGKETIKLCILPPPLFPPVYDDTKEPAHTVEIESKYFHSRSTEDSDAESEDDKSEEKKKTTQKRKSAAKAAKDSDDKPVRKRKTKEETKAEKDALAKLAAVEKKLAAVTAAAAAASAAGGGDVNMSDGDSKTETTKKAPRKSKKKMSADNNQPDAASALAALGVAIDVEANALGVHQTDVDLVKNRPVEGYLVDVKKKLSMTCPDDKFNAAYNSITAIALTEGNHRKFDVSKSTQAIHSFGLCELFAENDKHLRDLLVRLTRFTTLRDAICKERGDQTILNARETVLLANHCEISPEQIAMVLPVMWACMEMYGTNDGLKKQKHAKIFSEVKEIRAQRLMMEDLAEAPSISTFAEENVKSSASAAAAAASATDNKLVTPPPVDRKVPGAPKKTSRSKRRLDTDSALTAASAPSASTADVSKTNVKSAEPDLSGPADPLTSMIAPVVAETTAVSSDAGPVTKKTKPNTASGIANATAAVSTTVTTAAAAAVTATALATPTAAAAAASQVFKKPVSRVRIISSTDMGVPSLKRTGSVATAAATANTLMKMSDVSDNSEAKHPLKMIAEDRPLSSSNASETTKSSESTAASAAAATDTPVSSQMLDSDSMF